MKEHLRQMALALVYGALLVLLYFVSAGSEAVFVYQGF
jgi:hypothetical protein